MGCHPRTQTGVDLADDAQTSGDHKDVAQVKQSVFQCWTMILATCVLEDVSINLDIVIWEVSIILGVLHFDLGVGGYCISCLSCASW